MDFPSQNNSGKQNYLQALNLEVPNMDGAEKGTGIFDTGLAYQG